MSVVSMYRRIRWPAWWVMYRRKLPEPVEVLNLIDYGDREQFLWYSAFVGPAILAIGGGLQWAGEWQAALLGKRQSEALLLLRYPNHRRFLLMVTNPYYALINLFRQGGEARFQASFMQPQGNPRALGRQKQLLVAHCENESQAEIVERLLEKAGATRVYRVHEAASFEIFREFSASDPNPLKKKWVVFFEPGRLADGLTDALEKQLKSKVRGLSLQLYGRLSRGQMLPRPLAKLFVRRRAA